MTPHRSRMFRVRRWQRIRRSILHILFVSREQYWSATRRQAQRWLRGAVYHFRGQIESGYLVSGSAAYERAMGIIQFIRSPHVLQCVQDDHPY